MEICKDHVSSSAKSSKHETLRPIREILVTLTNVRGLCLEKLIHNDYWRVNTHYATTRDLSMTLASIVTIVSDEEIIERRYNCGVLSPVVVLQ